MKTFAARLLRHVASALRPALKPASETSEVLFVWSAEAAEMLFSFAQVNSATDSPVLCFAGVSFLLALSFQQHNPLSGCSYSGCLLQIRLY